MAVVVRRGPSQRHTTFGWNRGDDSFISGDSFRGRIYGMRGSISPDGKHWIYFARHAFRGSWTAIARVPELKALTVFRKPDGDTWNGGGIFTTNKTFWFNKDSLDCDVVIRESGHFLREPDDAVVLSAGGCAGVYGITLARNGWEVIRSRTGLTSYGKKLSDRWVLQKEFPANSIPGKLIDYEDHTLFSQDPDIASIPCPNWEWADWDAERKSLVWAQGGCLYRAPLPKADDGLKPKLLYDFNGMTFDRRQAPY